MSIVRSFLDLSEYELRCVVDSAYGLAMQILQSDIYQLDSDIRDSVDNILAITLAKREKILPGKAPFPECYAICDVVKVLGIGECESVCPEKFKKGEQNESIYKK